MTNLIITPKSHRARIEMNNLRENFHPALKKLDDYKRFSMADAGFEWNSAVLTRGKGSSIDFVLGNQYVNSAYVSGRIHNGVTPQPIIEVKDGKRIVGASTMTNDYVIGSLNEAAGIVKKVVLIGQPVLPEGQDGFGGGFGNENGEDETRYQDPRRLAFTKELVDKSEEIILEKLSRSFEDYFIVKMPSGWYVAYNEKNDEGLYIVADFLDLLSDKSSIIQSKSAIRFRRDSRGDWPDRVREYF